MNGTICLQLAKNLKANLVISRDFTVILLQQIRKESNFVYFIVTQIAILSITITVSRHVVDQEWD